MFELGQGLLSLLFCINRVLMMDVSNCTCAINDCMAALRHRFEFKSLCTILAIRNPVYMYCEQVCVKENGHSFDRWRALYF